MTSTHPLSPVTRVTDALETAGVPVALFGEDKEGAPICTRSGYRVTESGRLVSVALMGRSLADEGVRQGERDAFMQQARAALVQAGCDVRNNEYGHLAVVTPRLLSCGLCYEENGEEIHPHPECPL